MSGERREITLRLPTSAGLRRGFGAAVRALRRGLPARVAIGLLVVALVLVAALTTWAVAEQRQERRLHDARHEALVAAQQRVPLLLGYDFSTIDDDVATAKAQTTGDFAADYAQVLDDAVAPEATAQQITNEAAVSAAGVVEGDADEVVVLVFVTQTTLRGEDTEPALRGYRLEVTMREQGDGEWLIAGFEPV